MCNSLICCSRQYSIQLYFFHIIYYLCQTQLTKQRKQRIRKLPDSSNSIILYKMYLNFFNLPSTSDCQKYEICNAIPKKRYWYCKKCKSQTYFIFMHLTISFLMLPRYHFIGSRYTAPLKLSTHFIKR